MQLHPLKSWASKVAWRCATSGYMRDQIDRGDILFEGYGFGGMSEEVYLIKMESCSVNWFQEIALN